MSVDKETIAKYAAEDLLRDPLVTWMIAGSFNSAASNERVLRYIIGETVNRCMDRVNQSSGAQK